MRSHGSCSRTGTSRVCSGSSRRASSDAWAPIFFFALLFALAMDSSVFLLSAVREHRVACLDPREATIEALAGTGRTINVAAAVMIAVFMSFSLVGSLPVEKMGMILAAGVLLDAVLARLVLQPIALRMLSRPPARGRSSVAEAFSRS